MISELRARLVSIEDGLCSWMSEEKLVQLMNEKPRRSAKLLADFLSFPLVSGNHLCTFAVGIRTLQCFIGMPLAQE